MKNYFFVKKFIFAILFVASIVTFCIMNLVLFREDFEELSRELTKVSGIDDVKNWIANVEEVTTADVAGRMKFIETYGYIQRLMGKNEFNGFSYIQDEDKMLYYSSITEIDTEDLKQYADNIKRMNEYVNSKGADLLVCLPPTKVLYGESNVNVNWPINDPNNRTDALLNLLQEYDVAALDLRYAMKKSDLTFDEMFFKTDHHWTPKASIYAAGAVVDEIEERFGFELDPDNYYSDIDNYYSYCYEQSFLGSTGENTGVAYAGLDDYYFFWPKCDMEFEWYDYEHDDKQKGDFVKALMYENQLDDDKNVYEMSLGSIYGREIVDRDRIVNLSNPDGPTMAVLRDSYFNPLGAFLAPMFSQIDMVWTRNTSDIDLEDFVRETDADIYIIEVYPYNFDAVSFDFFNE